MKTVWLVMALCLLSIGADAQIASELIGKWKIKVLQAGLYHDFEKDSTGYPPEMLEALKGDKDSAFVMGFMDALVLSMKDVQMQFNKDGSYVELKSGRERRSGTYMVNEATKELVIVTKNKVAIEQAEHSTYAIIGKTLMLRTAEKEQEMVIQLERMD